MQIILISIFLINNEIACSQQSLKPTYKMDNTSNEADLSEILNVTRTLTTYMIEKNTTAINKMLDADFTLTHITGYVQTKKEWLAEIESESMKYYAYQEIKTSVKIDGQKAIFVGQNLLDARIWGSRNNWRLQQKMELEKRNGIWIILNSVATIF